MHAATGIPLNDPRSTYWVTTFSVAYLPAEETIVGAPWHFILIASAVLLALTWSRLGDGLYLPESRVRVLGWGNRLPDFAGWTGHVGLAFRADELAGGEAPKTWREMRTDHAELHFPAWGDALFFTATGFKSAPGADSLELAVNGRSIGRVELPEQAARFGFSLRIPCAAGNNTLSLRRSAGGGGWLKFTRIGFNDIDAAR
jgi:hypothetical protein